MSDKLTILTPVLRPEMALETVRSVQQAQPSPLSIEHRLVYWEGDPDPGGARLAAWATQLIKDVRNSWLMFVDDDNRLHPELPRRLAELIEANPDKTVFVFDSQYPAFGTLKADPARVGPGSIDGGQVVLWYWAAQEFPWPVGDCADGVWLRQLYQKDPGAFCFVNEPLTYHNAQRWAA